MTVITKLLFFNKNNNLMFIKLKIVIKSVIVINKYLLNSVLKMIR